VENTIIPWLLIVLGAVGSVIGIFNPRGLADSWAQRSGYIRPGGVRIRLLQSDSTRRFFNVAISLGSLALGIYLVYT
jgi:hypothetical protein